MTTNTFVYPHPINTFIIQQLNYTVQEFCEQFQYPQSTVATWVSRERRNESLQVYFIYSLSLATSKSMDWVYHELFKLQEEYDEHKAKFKRTKKKIEKE